MTIDQLRKHIREPFSQTYRTDLASVKHRLADRDAVLKQALDAFEIRAELPEIVVPEVELIYSESPDRELLDIADQLLDELEMLSTKIQRFIRQNNIYGTAHQRKTKITFKPSGEKSDAEELIDCLRAVSRVNAQKYVVDIFSDGSAELNEMLRALWNAIATLMTLPIRKQSWLFCFQDGTTATDEDICEVLAGMLRERYRAVNEAVDSAAFLAEWDEEAVFTCYDKMIALDSFSFMGNNRKELLRTGENETKLNALIGLSSIKDSVKKIKAYALANNSDTQGITDYGREALDTLVKAVEDNRGKFCVIFAGYKNEMLKMIDANPGMRSRIQFELDFPNYSREELRQITDRMLGQRKYTVTDSAMSRILDITDVKRKDPNFANARTVRNIVDQVIMCQNLRNMGTADREIGAVDVERYIQDAKLRLPASGDGGKRILTGDEELEQLIGLDAVKRTVKKIRAYAKRNQGQEDFNLHMCFRGNPGTGKTEVARILSRILYDAEILPEAKLIETDPHGLLGRFVGETAPKTLAKIHDAMNGVLFIDEAYGLAASKTAGGTASYGEEAIAILLKEMEDRRGQFCVIFAGYQDEMKTMLSSNPGLSSRIQFTLDFPDYTREELGAIAVAFLKKKKYEIEGPALNRLLDVTEYYRNRPNFANARTVRNILDHVIMNQNLRTEDTDGDNLVIADDVEDYLMDEGIDLTKAKNGQRHIGFAP